MDLIKVNDVEKHYQQLLAVKDLSFTVKTGNFVTLVGPFGCGKTTILNLIGGITENYNGSILIDSEPPMVVRKKRKIGYCFQKPNLLPWINTLENVLLPQKIASLKEDWEKGLALLEMVGLDKFADKRPYELSGGMQQLVSIARSLILDPDILLLDEPLSSIDEINRSKLHLKLLEIHRQTKKTTIMVTHSINEAVFLSNQVIVLTARPARVRKIVDIEIIQRNEETVYSDKFLKYAELIKEELRNGQTN